MIVRKLWVRIATGKHDVDQGVPTRLGVINLSPQMKSHPQPYLYCGQMLKLSVGVWDGSEQIEVGCLIHPELTVLVSGQQFVTRRGGEVSTVDSLVMVELSQGRLSPLDVSDVPHLDTCS